MTSRAPSASATSKSTSNARRSRAERFASAREAAGEHDRGAELAQSAGERDQRRPLAAGGLGGGWALAFARGIGEFGATIMFAGSLQGVTQTLSLAVYEQFDVDFDVALAIGAELVVVSAAILLAVKLVPSWTSSTSTSTTLSAPSASR